MRYRKLYTAGVVIGRFQTPFLHVGHKYLLDHMVRNHHKGLVLVGCRASQPTERDPLDYHTRRIMLEHAYPNLMVRPIYDNVSDVVWSQEVDKIIKEIFPFADATLYGSRDSFISNYHGEFKCEEVGAIKSPSGTDLRNEGDANLMISASFRQGVIYAISNQRYPTAYQTVDVAILHTTEPKVLLGRKKDSDKWCFIGGFVDPDDRDLESAAKREVREEVGSIEIDSLQYIGSAKIDDWRYRGVKDSIVTTFFATKYIFGSPRADDDIVEVDWHPLESLLERLADSHVPLGKMLLGNLGVK